MADVAPKISTFMRKLSYRKPRVWARLRNDRGRASGSPAVSRFAAHVMHVDAVAAHVDHREHDGELKAARADRPRVDDREPLVSTEEGDVGVPAHDDRRIGGARQASRVGAELGAVDGDVQKEQ